MVPSAGEATIRCLIAQQFVHNFDDKWSPSIVRDAVLARGGIGLEDAAKSIRDDAKIALIGTPTDHAGSGDVKPSPWDALWREAAPDEKFDEFGTAMNEG